MRELPSRGCWDHGTGSPATCPAPPTRRAVQELSPTVGLYPLPPVSNRLAENGLAGAQSGEHTLGDGLTGEADLLAEQRRLAVRDVAVREADPQHAGPLGTAGEGVLDVLEHP